MAFLNFVEKRKSCNRQSLPFNRRNVLPLHTSQIKSFIASYSICKQLNCPASRTSFYLLKGRGEKVKGRSARKVEQNLYDCKIFAIRSLAVMQLPFTSFIYVFPSQLPFVKEIFSSYSSRII